MEQKIRDSLSLAIILVPILFCVYAVANAYFYYTMINYGDDAPVNTVIASTTNFVNDTTRPSNLTTMVDEILPNEEGKLIVKFSHLTREQGLEIDYFQCSIDNVDWGECSSPVKIPLKDYQDNKTHTLEIRAVDMEGNREETPIAILFPLNETEIISLK